MAPEHDRPTLTTTLRISDFILFPFTLGVNLKGWPVACNQPTERVVAACDANWHRLAQRLCPRLSSMRHSPRAVANRVCPGRHKLPGCRQLVFLLRPSQIRRAPVGSGRWTPSALWRLSCPTPREPVAPIPGGVVGGFPA